MIYSSAIFSLPLDHIRAEVKALAYRPHNVPHMRALERKTPQPYNRDGHKLHPPLPILLSPQRRPKVRLTNNAPHDPKEALLVVPQCFPTPQHKGNHLESLSQEQPTF